MHDLSKLNLEDPAYLIISPREGEPSVFELEKGGSVFVGSGSNCRLMLPGQSVHPIHCMIWLDEEKRLKVQDWNTGETVLNDKVLDADTNFESGDILTIGNYRLIPVLSREFHTGIAVDILEKSKGWGETKSRVESSPEPSIAEPQQPDYPSLESLGEDDELVVPISFADDEITSETTEPAMAEQSAIALPAPEPVEIPEESVEAAASSEPEQGPSIQRGEFTYDVDADLNAQGADDFTQDVFGGENSFATSLPMDEGMDFGDDADDETTLLRMEVEQLRFEIAEKNAALRSMSEMNSQANHDVIDDSQTLKLVGRLEELLDELQHSDERVRSLEELLRLSDEATEAEKEERTQLEKWVSEIEQRVSSRDQEHTAEIQRLTVRLERAQEDLRNTEGQIENLIKSQRQSGAPDAEAQELIEKSRQHILELRDKIDQLKQENDELRSQCNDHAASADDDPQTVKELQDKLVQMQVDSSRERAEMARRHAELERMRDTLQDQLANAKTVTAGDSKIVAMREHLREIHAKEKVEEEERRKNSLSGRIANLLSRLR